MNKLKLTIVLLFICLVGFGQLKNGAVLMLKLEEPTAITPRDETQKQTCTNNGADVNITGIQGTCYDFDYTQTDNISITDNNLLSFTDGSSDLKFSINMWIYPHFITTIAGDGEWYFNKRGATSGTDEYQLIVFNEELLIALFDQSDNSNQIQALISSPITINNWQMLTATYDGSESETGLKIYRNSTLLSTTNTEAGTYTGMPNGSSVAKIATASWDLQDDFSYDGKIDEVMVYRNVELNQNMIDQLYTNGNGRLYVWENFINGKITYSEWLDYSLRYNLKS